MAAHADGRDEKPADGNQGRVGRSAVFPGEPAIDFPSEGVKIDVHLVAQADQFSRAGDPDVAVSVLERLDRFRGQAIRQMKAAAGDEGGVQAGDGRGGFRTQPADELVRRPDPLQEKTRHDPVGAVG